MFYRMFAKPERLFSLLVLAAGIAGRTPSAYAQHSTAMAGYYPDCYHGDVFSGTLAATDDASDLVTLTYPDSKHNKNQTLAGVIVQDYSVRSRADPAAHHLRASELTLGKRYTVLYCVAQQKINGEKVTTNSIFLIDSIPNLTTRRAMYMAF